MIYPDLESARSPVPHSFDVHVSEMTKHINLKTSESYFGSEVCDEEYITSTSIAFTQGEQNHLVRELDLNKDAAELLSSRKH